MGTAKKPQWLFEQREFNIKMCQLYKINWVMETKSVTVVLTQGDLTASSLLQLSSHLVGC